MATVYVGCLSGPAGFRRIVAIKRAHPHLLEDPACRRMLVTEAKMAALVRHPNVIGVQDVEELDGELLLVMDYIEGGSLAQMLRANTPELRLAPSLALRVIGDACEGLHAMHHLRDDDGNALGLVHRDVSPQNILVGMDGMARLADFGIAKSSSPEWPSHTESGALRGKTGYLAPEYVETTLARPQSDIFSLGVVAWEAITRQRLFKGATDVETIKQVRSKAVPPPSTLVPELPSGVDEVILKALARDPGDRWSTARAFGEALEQVLSENHALASHGAVQGHMQAIFLDALTKRRAAIRTLQAAPPPRPVSVSEVEAAEIVPPHEQTPPPPTPSTESMPESAAVALPPKVDRKTPSLTDDEPPASRLATTASKPNHILALSAAVLSVVVVVLGIVALGLSRRPAETSVTTTGAVASLGDSAKIAATLPADQLAPDLAKSSAQSDDVPKSAGAPAQVTPTSTLRKPATSRHPSGQPAAIASIALAKTTMLAVPKNPYAP